MTISQLPSASLEEQLARTDRALEVVHAVARAILVPHDLLTLSRTLFQSLRSFITVDAGFLERFDREHDQCVTVYSIDETIEEIELKPWPWRRSALISWVIRNRQPLVFDDLQTEMPVRFPNARLSVFGDTAKLSRSWLAVPLLLGDELVGIVGLSSYQIGIYGEPEIYLLQTLANPIAVALENAQLVTTLERSVRDLRLPIIRLNSDMLMAPLVDMLDWGSWDSTTEQMLSAVQEQQASGILLDASGLLDYDPQMVQALMRLTAALQMMGAQSVLIGMRPQLIEQLVSARLDFSPIHTARDLQAGLQLLHRLIDNG